MIDFTPKDVYNIDDLLRIMTILRSKDGCPWDRAQTHKSIRRDFIEETYEAVEAIDNADSDLLCEELGDVLLQVVFHAEIEREAGRFSFDEIVNGVCQKLVHRHPHVFGDLSIDTADEVLANWNKIKADDKNQSITETLLAVSKALPALIRAQKVAKRSEAAGEIFTEAEIAAKIRALAANTEDDENIGELLFFTAFLAEKRKKDSELLLSAATNAYIKSSAESEKE
ncbi:MAG: MazG family protein [Ruminococcus sp.]|jgi:tetrapyrrole methylase family protein/MazG family protein|nr:MazG family protein [Ruminococcus sp.]